MTRPHITFAISDVSQFLNSPYKSHWDAVIQILRYIKRSPKKGIVNENKGHTDLIAYTKLQMWDGLVYQGIAGQPHDIVS